MGVGGDLEIPGDPLATKKHIAGNQETEKWIFLVTPFGFSIVSLMHAYVFLCFLRFSYDSALLYLCPSFVFLCFPVQVVHAFRVILCCYCGPPMIFRCDLLLRLLN